MTDIPPTPTLITTAPPPGDNNPNDENENNDADSTPERKTLLGKRTQKGRDRGIYPIHTHVYTSTSFSSLGTRVLGEEEQVLLSLRSLSTGKGSRCNGRGNIHLALATQTHTQNGCAGDGVGCCDEGRHWLSTRKEHAQTGEAFAPRAWRWKKEGHACDLIGCGGIFVFCWSESERGNEKR